MPDRSASSARVCVGEFLVDRDDERLIGPDGPVKLGNKAFRVLCALIDQGGQLLTKDALFDTVWDGTVVSEGALTSTVKELRRALGDGSRDPRYIESVYGRGYRLIASVSEAPSNLVPSKQFEQQKAVEAQRPPIIVVSGFNDEAVREHLPYFGPALREEVLSGLSRFREIQLISDKHFDEHRPASMLNNRSYQLTATLFPEREGAKLIIRLRRLGDGLILWVESMSVGKEGLLDRVDRIVRKIIGAVLPVVDQDVFQTLNVSENLYDRYVEAKYLVLRGSDFQTAKHAAKLLEAMVRERPQFALPYGELVRLYNTDHFFTGFGSSNADTRAKAFKLALTQQQTDPGEPMSYITLAFCNLYAGRWKEAEANARRCLACNPFNPVMANAIAAVFTYLGDFDQAEEHLARSEELQPFPNNNHHCDVGRLHILRANPAAAAEAFAMLTDRDVWSHLYEALNAHELGRDDADRDFLDWKRRIVTGWHDGKVPSDDRILEFVRYHHPFRDAAGETLFGMAQAALERTAA